MTIPEPQTGRFAFWFREVCLTDEFEMTTVSSPQALSLRQRVGKAIKGIWQDTPPMATTTLGVSSEQLEKWYSPFFKLSSERMDVYRDVSQMDDTVDEVAKIGRASCRERV